MTQKIFWSREEYTTYFVVRDVWKYSMFLYTAGNNPCIPLTECTLWLTDMGEHLERRTGSSYKFGHELTLQVMVISWWKYFDTHFMNSVRWIEYTIKLRSDRIYTFFRIIEKNLRDSIMEWKLTPRFSYLCCTKRFVSWCTTNSIKSAARPVRRKGDHTVIISNLSIPFHFISDLFIKITYIGTFF